MTWGVLALPPAFFWAGLYVPPPTNIVMIGSAIFMVVLYASVALLFRPTRFVVDAAALRIVWPLRMRTIDRGDVVDVRSVTSKEFHDEFGYGMRVGVGGLWGGFGLLKTSRETFSMWISRTDRFVVVMLKGARPLLLTPDDPDRFVASLAPHVSGR